MHLLLECSDYPAALLNIHRDALLLGPGPGDLAALGGGLVPALLPGHQVLLGPRHGHAHIPLHLATYPTRDLATLEVRPDDRGRGGAVAVHVLLLPGGEGGGQGRAVAVNILVLVVVVVVVDGVAVTVKLGLVLDVATNGLCQGPALILLDHLAVFLLHNVGHNFRNSAALFLENLSTFFLFCWNSDNGALVLLDNLALGGVDGLVLDDGVDLALLVGHVTAHPLHHCLLLGDPLDVRHVDALLLLGCDALVLQLGDRLVPALLRGDVLAVWRLHHAALLLLHLPTLLLAHCLVPRLAFLLGDLAAHVPHHVPAQLLLLVVTVLPQLRLVHHLALLLLHDGALLGVLLAHSC